MAKGSIAVIIPVYNGEKTIDKSITSLINQTISNWFCIIVDDGSTDDTSIILEKYKKDERFVIISLPQNKGRGYARKIGLEKTKELGAEYMCMLDADDFYYPNKLQMQFDYMECHKNIALASYSIALIDNNFDIVSVLESFPIEKMLKFEIYKNCIEVPHASSIIRVSEIKNETFDESYRFSEDLDFMIRFLINKEYVFVPIICYLYSRECSFSLSKYKKSLDYKEKTYSKLSITRKEIFKLQLVNKLKFFYIVLLKLTGLIDLYIGRIGRKPYENEINNHYLWLTEYKYRVINE